MTTARHFAQQNQRQGTGDLVQPPLFPPKPQAPPKPVKSLTWSLYKMLPNELLNAWGMLCRSVTTVAIEGGRAPITL